MKSKTKAKAAVGIAAYAASSSTSTATAAIASLPSSSAAAASSSSWSLAATPSLLDRIPRGGHSPPASAEAETTATTSAPREGANEGEKKRKKKKKSKARPKSSSASTAGSTASSPPKPKQQSQQSQSQQSTDASSSTQQNKNDNSSSSSSSPLPPAAQSILSQTCHYDVLGITKSATQVEIQKAYRRRCVLTHPDKTQGDRSAFDKVSAAYDVLSCSKKRAVYDKFGLEGLENGMDVNDMANNGMRGFGFGGSGSSFFGGGNDVFREFFGADPFFGRRQSQQQSQQQSQFRSRTQPKNRDLRYQLEVTLEELYRGTTKHVAIQQPNPLRPHFPYRKEVEVTLSKGMCHGQNVRISGVVDSIPDAAPADVVFLLRERRHPVFTRRGCDLAMEVKISFAESIVGYRRKITCLDGKEIEISSPYVRSAVLKEELVDEPDLPSEVVQVENEAGISLENANNGTNTAANFTKTSSEEAPDTAVKESVGNVTETNAQIGRKKVTKTTTLSYHLPPSIIQTGDVHVLKGYGMPKQQRGSSHHGHHDTEYGDLYVQYIVEAPGQQQQYGSSSTAASVDNLTPEERVELAHLLNKLEGGKDDPTVNIVTSSSDENAGNMDDYEGNKEKEATIHHLAMASASDFGKSSSSPTSSSSDMDEHLRHDEDDVHPRGYGGMPQGAEDISEFFQRAFTGGGRSSAGGFGGPFGLGGTGGGFHYFSSSGRNGSGGGYGYNRPYGEDDDHKVECNQM